MVLFPGCQVEGTQAGERSEDGFPAVTQIDGAGENGDAERSVDSVNAVVKEFTEWAGLAGAASLGTITRIKGLVEEKAERPGSVDPRRAVGVEGGVVPEESEEVDYNEGEAGEGDKVRAGE